MTATTPHTANEISFGRNFRIIFYFFYFSYIRHNSIQFRSSWLCIRHVQARQSQSRSPISVYFFFMSSFPSIETRNIRHTQSSWSTQAFLIFILDLLHSRVSPYRPTKLRVSATTSPVSASMRISMWSSISLQCCCRRTQAIMRNSARTLNLWNGLRSITYSDSFLVKSSRWGYCDVKTTTPFSIQKSRRWTNDKIELWRYVAGASMSIFCQIIESAMEPSDANYMQQ